MGSGCVFLKSRWVGEQHFHAAWYLWDRDGRERLYQAQERDRRDWATMDCLAHGRWSYTRQAGKLILL
jgi:hypothetical protein